MALTATLYHFETELADIDRGVYETFATRFARQPSETLEYMLTRYLAYCLEYAEGISLTEGVAAGDEPAVLVRDLTGRVTTWVEVGMPGSDRVHRAAKAAPRVAVYTHRAVAQVLAQLTGKGIHRAGEIPVYTFGAGFIDAIAPVVERRNTVVLSVNERQVYLDIGGSTFSTEIAEHRIS